MNNNNGKTKLDNFPVLLTSLEEQESISKYVKNNRLNTETAITQQQAQIEKLKEYKATLINSGHWASTIYLTADKIMPLQV